MQRKRQEKMEKNWKWRIESMVVEQHGRDIIIAVMNIIFCVCQTLLPIYMPFSRIFFAQSHRWKCNADKTQFYLKAHFFRLLDALLCAEKSSKMLYTYCSWIVQKIDLTTVNIPYKATQRNTFHTSAHWEFIFCELSHCNSASVTLNGLRMATRPAFCIPQWYWNY